MLRIFIRATIVSLLAFLLLFPLGIFFFSRRRIMDDNVVDKHEYAMVLGAGVRPDGKPSDMLKDRLQVAVNLFEAGKIKKIIVSGDNMAPEYNEPVAMANYLIDRGVPSEAILRDYGGRRTYDSCARLKNVWKVDSAVIVTQTYHLFRSIWLCEKLGVKSVGVSASLQKYRGSLRWKAREVIAIYKSWFDVYIWYPKYVVGNGKEFEEGSELIPPATTN